MKKIIRQMLLVVLATQFFGCATILNGTHEDISISSTPSRAKVTIDHQPYGQTPVIANLSRKKKHIVKISQPGFYDYEMIITQHVSGALLGNILLGGLIGLVVDASSGGMWELKPTDIRAYLRKTDSPVENFSEEVSLFPTDRNLIDAEFSVVWETLLDEITKMGYKMTTADMKTGTIETDARLEYGAGLSEISDASFSDEQDCNQKKTRLSLTVEPNGEKTMVIVTVEIEGYIDYGGIESGEWARFESNKMFEAKLLHNIQQRLKK
ncbi:hypothetical protein Ctha_0794 [Chloroherpeton thalassium ATCC 35110]|uniref:PEGA domain-containing protein n=1 Tax=Chloroherpeton thalassium (strain ATCC 35110 / GB-78) TaxID=517418 RepID=B3QWE9_CHLT3|nr:PEGA domain-containing protein [Chloroherpeton thalassium]ACF13262.1 hypothetical protein Ctha_0794 [Chloroherpeton thalassium ATCC 35110]